MGILRQDTECKVQSFEKYQVEQKQSLEDTEQEVKKKPYEFEFCVFVLMGASVRRFLF